MRKDPRVLVDAILDATYAVGLSVIDLSRSRASRERVFGLSALRLIMP